MPPAIERARLGDAEMLDGKVAIVTGAARGLGREEALELARHGARVVVNDLGASGDGSGRDTSAADSVVSEIRAAGGEAVPHFGDVADWNDSQAMIRTAIDSYGDLNILVNNAGFCRDKMIFNGLLSTGRSSLWIYGRIKLGRCIEGRLYRKC